jgi:hypothetical protein
MECRLMEPIVHGLIQQYRECLTLERVNYHAPGAWQDKINPMGAPEFDLVDASGKIVYRWVGFSEKAGFDEVLKPLCG